MKKDGFMLVELLVSLSFTFIILVNIVSLSINLSQKMSNIYISSNINNTINLLSDKIGYDVYNNESIDCDENNIIINNNLMSINNNNLKYGDKIYSNKNIAFQNVICENKGNYYKISIIYEDLNSDEKENLDFFSLKKVS